jgi:hypothetical protein
VSINTPINQSSPCKRPSPTPPSVCETLFTSSFRSLSFIFHILCLSTPKISRGFPLKPCYQINVQDPLHQSQEVRGRCRVVCLFILLIYYNGQDERYGEDIIRNPPLITKPNNEDLLFSRCFEMTCKMFYFSKRCFRFSKHLER